MFWQRAPWGQAADEGHGDDGDIRLRHEGQQRHKHAEVKSPRLVRLCLDAMVPASAPTAIILAGALKAHIVQTVLPP